MTNYTETFESELYTTVQDLLDDDEWHGFNSQQFKFPVPTKILAKIKFKLKDFGFESTSKDGPARSESAQSMPAATAELPASKAKYVKFTSGNAINTILPDKISVEEIQHPDVATTALNQQLQSQRQGGHRPNGRTGADEEGGEVSRSSRSRLHHSVARKMRWERDLEESAAEAGTTRREREKRGLATMSEGQVLRGYFHNRGRGRSIKQDLFIFYSSNLVPPAKGDTDPGAIYWCEASQRTKSKDCCLPFTQIADVYLGKQTKVFLLPFAADAKEDRCFSIILKDRTHVNFEAFNAEQRALWVYGIEAILLGMAHEAGDHTSPGKSPHQYIPQRQSPPQLKQQQQQPKQQLQITPPKQQQQQRQQTKNVQQISPQSIQQQSLQEQQQSKVKRGKRGELKEMSSKQRLVTELATQLIKTGDTFTGYYLQGTDQALVISAAFFVFYDDVHPATAAQSYLPGSGAPTDEPGCLYWCEPGTRVASRKCCLPLIELTDVYFGKQSRVLASSAAATAPDDLCVTLVSEHGTRLGLCASSKSMLTSWIAGISTLRAAYNLRALREHRARASSEDTLQVPALGKPVTANRSETSLPNPELTDGTLAPSKIVGGTKVGPSSRSPPSKVAGEKMVDRSALAIRMLKAPSPSSNIIDENVVIRMMVRILFTFVCIIVSHSSVTLLTGKRRALHRLLRQQGQGISSQAACLLQRRGCRRPRRSALV
jgi:hypothetical protein